MAGTTPGVRTRTRTATKIARPKMFKVILLNDDFTPREFVCVVLRGVFGLGPEQAERVMLTAHQRGACVVAVYTREVAETKAAMAVEMGRRHGHPLTFTVEAEE